MGSSKNIRLGAQTISPFTDGKHTGDVSATMLKSLGVGSVIIGHSERRAPRPEGLGETDEEILVFVYGAPTRHGNAEFLDDVETL